MNMETLNESIEKLHATFDRTDVEVEQRKIEKKLREASFNPGDIRPLADCVYSLLLAARSRGYKPEDVFRELDKVAADNLVRRWKKMEDGTYQST